MTDDPLIIAGAVLTALAALAALGAIIVAAIRTMRRNDAEAADKRMAELARLQVETSARLSEMRDTLAGRQAELHRAVNERLDSVTHHLSQSMTATRQHTADNLSKLNERLAVIDGAQKNITELATQVTSLQNVLSNKQSRGAFGQGRMEVIIQDGLPKGCYEFQFTLSNRSRPDCAIFLPDQRPLVIDAKFPLEAVNAFRDAKSDEERKVAAARLRADIGRHVSDIAQKYLIPGETQDLALMFVPSEFGLRRALRRLRRHRAEGVPLQGGHRLALAADARDQRGAADPEGRAHARSRRQDPRRGRPPDG